MTDREMSEAQWDRDDVPLDLEQIRYFIRDPWILSALPFHYYKDKCVFEIGYGHGLDLIRFAKSGALVSGIDLSKKSYLVTSTRFRQEKVLYQNFIVGDARSLPCRSDQFDLVFSIGVLHHIKEAKRVVSEMFRILKPGGKVIVAVYSLWSKFFWIQKIFREGLIEGKLFSLGLNSLLGTIELGANGENRCPYIALYTRMKLKRLFRNAGFKIYRIWKPQGSFGWYLVFEGWKPL